MATGYGFGHDVGIVVGLSMAHSPVHARQHDSWDSTLSTRRGPAGSTVWSVASSTRQPSRGARRSEITRPRPSGDRDPGSGVHLRLRQRQRRLHAPSRPLQRYMDSGAPCFAPLCHARRLPASPCSSGPGLVNLRFSNNPEWIPPTSSDLNQLFAPCLASLFV